MATLQQMRAIKEVINRNFTFSDLSPRFKNIDSSSGNIFCPFHENHESPAAKMYWNEESELWVIHCFGECHRNFTAYDYVKLILCEKYQRYDSPLDFLKVNMPEAELLKKLSDAEKEYYQDSQASYQDKIRYINNTYEESESLADYLETLYTS